MWDKPACFTHWIIGITQVWNTSYLTIHFCLNLDATPTTSAICFPVAITKRSRTGHCIFVTVQYGGLTIVVIYKSPMFPKSKFKEMLQVSLPSVNTDVIYVGDINLDISDKSNADLIEIFVEYNLKLQLNLMDPSTNGGTHIDICFSDLDYLICWFYESYYSYHKPICIAWPNF